MPEPDVAPLQESVTFKEKEIGISAAYDLSLLPNDEQTQVLDEYKETGAEAIRQATAKFHPSSVPAVVPPAEKVAPKVEAESATLPKVATPPPPEEHEQHTINPAHANEAQRDILLNLGKEAVRDFCKAADHEHQVRVAEQIEAYTNVATAFGIRDYEEEIHSIPEYKSKYGIDAKEGA